MMRLALYLLLIAWAALLTPGCSGPSRSHDSGEPLVPRREGYIRLTPYDSIYSPAGPMGLELNAATQTTVTERPDGTLWIDVRYPRYGATLRLTYLTGTPAEIARAVDNRMERARLNIGSNSADITELTSADGSVESMVMLSHASAVTPLQLLSTDRRSALLTGVAEFDRPDAEANRPAAEAIRSDLIHLAKRLSVK